MASSLFDRFISRWIVVTAGILGLVSLLLGATGLYFEALGASNWQMPTLLGVWGLELALFLGAVASVQALWSLLRRASDTAQFGFYAFLSIGGLTGFLSAMVAVIAAFLWLMSSPTSLLFGKIAAMGLGATLLLAGGAFTQ